MSLDWSRKIWIGAGSVMMVNQVDMAVAVGAVLGDPELIEKGDYKSLSTLLKRIPGKLNS